MKPFYKETVAQSWRLSLRQRWLWPLAFFASFLGLAPTFRAVFDLTPEAGTNGINLADVTNADFITSNFIGWSQSFFQIPWDRLGLADIPWLALIILVLLVIIFLTVVVISSQGGLIVGIANVLKNKKTTYLQIFRQGVDKFWELFILNFFYRLIYILIFGAVIVPLTYLAIYAEPGYNLLLLAISYFILVPVLIILDIVVRYAIIFVMLKNSKLPKAFDQGWDLFKNNWLISIETSLMILALMVVYVFIIIQVLWLLLQLFIFFAITVPAGGMAYQIILFTGLMTALAIVVVGFIIFTTFYLGIWTNIFTRITTEEHHSKIHRSVRYNPWLHTKIGK